MPDLPKKIEVGELHFNPYAFRGDRFSDNDIRRVDELAAHRYNVHEELVKMLDLFVGCEKDEKVTPLCKKKAQQLLTKATAMDRRCENCGFWELTENFTDASGENLGVCRTKLRYSGRLKSRNESCGEFVEREKK